MLDKKVNELINSGQQVRLHLGCGNRLFEGYLNVDGDYMSHDPNVTIHDIASEYPITDNSVDEILSVHVIEHISREQVPTMFREWHRILKSGGLVAIEWPDLLKMCQAIVADPTCLYTEDRKVQKRTISGIFGDSVRYPNPAMLHKWGYSAESMSRLFTAAGFSRVFVEPNQYSKTNIDSRVVAVK
jgi:predicted SAM-dependent methyltransferase